MFVNKPLSLKLTCTDYLLDRLHNRPWLSVRRANRYEFDIRVYGRSLITDQATIESLSPYVDRQLIDYLQKERLALRVNFNFVDINPHFRKTLCPIVNKMIAESIDDGEQTGTIILDLFIDGRFVSSRRFY